jgi:hypothetical protein
MLDIATARALDGDPDVVLGIPRVVARRMPAVWCI